MPFEIETKLHEGFRIIRLIDDHLMASDCQLDITIDIPADSPKRDAANRIKAMKLWLGSFVDGSVAIGAGTEMDTTTIEKISNNVLICPDDPHDYLLLMLIHAKLTAIGGGLVIVTRTALASDTGDGFSNAISGINHDWLPSMDEWMGPKAFHDVPWWNRSDSSTMDMRPEPGDDPSNVPDLGSDLIAMVDKQAERPSSGPEKVEPAEIIKPTFKPKVITSDD